MWYWIGAFMAWFIGLAGILSIMSDVIRGRKSGLSPLILAGYGVHGAFAVLALWLVFMALGAGCQPWIALERAEDRAQEQEGVRQGKLYGS